MGGPAGVCNAGVGAEDLVHVHFGLCDELSELDHLAHLFERIDLIASVSVDGQTSRVVATIFQTSKACTPLSAWAPPRWVRQYH